MFRRNTVSLTDRAIPRTSLTEPLPKFAPLLPNSDHCSFPFSPPPSDRSVVGLQFPHKLLSLGTRKRSYF